MLFVGEAKLYASRSALDQASLHKVVVLNGATRLSHDVDYPLSIGVAELAPNLSITVIDYVVLFVEGGKSLLLGRSL